MSAMENATREAINARTPEMTDESEVVRWLEAIDRHYETGEGEYFYMKNEDALSEFVKLVGHEAITSRQMLKYHYEATSTERLERKGSRLNFKGHVSIHELEAWIGDFGSMLEFPNSFKVWIAVALDAESMIVYQHETQSSGVVCEDCVNSTDPEVTAELALAENSGYGCGHVDDDYEFKNSAFITKRKELQDVEETSEFLRY